MKVKFAVTKVLPRSHPKRARVARLGLGVSLDNPKFTGESFDGILDWCDAHSERCLVFLGDALYAHTHRILTRDSVQEAAMSATDRANTAQAVVEARGQSKFTTIRLSELAGSPDHEERVRQVQAWHKTGGTFASFVRDTAQKYVARNERANRLSLPLEEAVEVSTAYILDEVAFYWSLAADGWGTDAYPGPEMPVLAAILEGKITDAPAELRDRIFYQLEPIALS